jgi:hypothetical protein
MSQWIRQRRSKVLRNDDGASFTGVIATATLLEANKTLFLECLDRSKSKYVSDRVSTSCHNGAMKM